MKLSGKRIFKLLFLSLLVVAISYTSYLSYRSLYCSVQNKISGRQMIAGGFTVYNEDGTPVDLSKYRKETTDTTLVDKLNKQASSPWFKYFQSCYPLEFNNYRLAARIFWAPVVTLVLLIIFIVTLIKTIKRRNEVA